MYSIASGALGDLDAALVAFGGVDWDALTVRERLEALDRLETARRRAAAVSLDLVGSIDRAGEAAVGRTCHAVIADVVRITPAEARRRLRDAAQLQPRTTATGQPMPPELPATATAWNAGLLDPEHLRVIQGFVRALPLDVHPADAAKAEGFLAEQAADLRPDQLQKLADKVALTLNPDGRFCDEYRARQRGFSWCGPQRADGMSVGKLVATPELRALLDAWLAKFAAPGMCNPQDETPIVTGEPDQGTVDRDPRGHGQRQHDALAALLRGRLGDPELGQHNGLPVTIIASATVQELTSATGHAVTGGGTLLPMRDLIRMASHALHYLCVFDEHTQRPVYLGRSRRVASAEQRIVLHAKDRGCSAPGCDVPGYLTEVHHIDEWSGGGRTDPENLTFACGPHHRLLSTGGWKTRRRGDGSTEWIPPAHLPLRAAVNTFHHAERLLPKQSPG